MGSNVFRSADTSLSSVARFKHHSSDLSLELSLWQAARFLQTQRDLDLHKNTSVCMRCFTSTIEKRLIFELQSVPDQKRVGFKSSRSAPHLHSEKKGAAECE